MMMEKTNYTITSRGNNTIVSKDGKLEAQGFTDMESCLHSVWVMEGKQAGTFFVESCGVVYKKEVL